MIEVEKDWSIEVQKKPSSSLKELSWPNLEAVRKAYFSNLWNERILDQNNKKEGIPASKKVEWLKLPDWKEINEENYKDLKASDTLKMKDIDRLNLFSKWDKNLDRKDLQKWTEITVDYSKFWDKNKDLYLNTSAWEILPIEVWSIETDWKEYTRNWINWEFVDKNWNILVIKDWTKLEINKRRENEDFNKLTEDYLKNKKEFLEKNKIDEKDPNYKENIELIEQRLLKWLSETEIKFIIDWKYEELAKITTESKRKEVFKNLQTFKESWLIDWSVGWKASIDKPDLSNLKFPWVPPEKQEKLKWFIDKSVLELWNDENSWNADKYLKDFWDLSSRTTPWCAAFVNWTLKEASLKWNWSLSSKSFIGEWGKWHVWIKIWDKLLAWNQSNMVSTKPLNTPTIKWYVLPIDLNNPIIKWPFTQDKIPDWAIVVYDRWKWTT